MEEIKIKKFLTITLIIFLISISAVSASQLNNDTDSTLISNDEKIDVDLDAKETIGIYGNNNTHLNVHVTDENGENVNEGSVTFYNVFGRNYTANVEDGMAETYVFTNEVGKFNITCEYLGTEIFKNRTTTFILDIPVADSFCNNVVATRYGNTVFFTGNMVADYRAYEEYEDYVELTEGNLTIFVDNEQLPGYCDVDINGNYVYIWNTTRNLIGETINFTAYFKNDLGHFKSSNFTRLFTFAPPKDTRITAEVTVIDENTKLVTGTVVDGTGTNVLGGKMTVNGNYEIPVDANGRFTFYITNEAIKKANYEIGVMDWGSKANIRVNIPLMERIEHTPLVEELIDLCLQGTPYIKFGNGNGKTIVVNAGLHGGELASQAAGFELINYLAAYGGEIDGTIYIFPTLFPEAVANNTRIYNGINLNKIADQNGTLSNNLVKFALSVGASGIGDFHCTRHSNSDVGITCVMCSLTPTYESYLLGKFIADETGYELDVYEEAGVPYAGALEDYANILGICAITSESLTNHRGIEYGSPELSFNMMRAYLKYFGFDIDKMAKINIDNDELNLLFTSSYNYNSSSMKMIVPKPTACIAANPASYVINYGGKYSIIIKDSNNNPLNGKKVIFTLNGKNIGSAMTNSKGVATISLTSKILKTAKAGTRNLVIKLSDSKYNPVSKTVKIKINKEKTKIAAKKKTFKKSQRIKKYTISLKNSKGKAVKKVKVTMKVKGKTFKAKTNAKGKATFKITKLTRKGTFKAKIRYNGSGYYMATAKNVKIKIK